MTELANTPATQVSAEVGDYLRRQGCMDLLRFITCGSVDDGKSTLIGRLLYDSKLLFDDQLESLTRDTARYGTTEAGRLDLALLMDGLAAEREQGITIDVAYRFFTTRRRKFIVADTPGHEQYTRNMVTGASTADLAVLLVDARKGILTQTRRHSHIVSLLGIQTVVLAINKMDMIGWDRITFKAIATEYCAFADRIGLCDVVCIPVSALAGDNVTTASAAMPWYEGPTLLEHLETVNVGNSGGDAPLRLPVQWVNRPNQDFRGFSGTIVRGRVRPGDRVVALPGGQETAVARIVTMDGDLEQAVSGQAVTLVLADEIDITRGDVIASAVVRPEVVDQFAAHLVWMNEHPLLVGRLYLLRLGTATVGAQITRLKHAINVNSLEHVEARHLDLNQVGAINVALDRPVPFDSYCECRETGGFILIDRLSNATLACGMIDHPLRRATNLGRFAMKVDKKARAVANRQKPFILWFTGLSGAGKSTLANLVEQELHRRGHHTMSLDGDNIRHGLNKDLGFTEEDRVENIRRVAEVARLMVEAGLVVLVSVISPFCNERQLARSLVQADEFLEIFVNTPLEMCEARDTSGLYRKMRAGQLPNLTGINSPYELPEQPDLVVLGGSEPAEATAARIIAFLEQRDILRPFS